MIKVEREMLLPAALEHLVVEITQGFRNDKHQVGSDNSCGNDVPTTIGERKLIPRRVAVRYPHVRINHEDNVFRAFNHVTREFPETGFGISHATAVFHLLGFGCRGWKANLLHRSGMVRLTPMCSGRLGKGFTDNFSLGGQPIVKVVTVFAATLFIYLVSA